MQSKDGAVGGAGSRQGYVPTNILERFWSNNDVFITNSSSTKTKYNLPASPHINPSRQIEKLHNVHGKWIYALDYLGQYQHFLVNSKRQKKVKCMGFQKGKWPKIIPLFYSEMIKQAISKIRNCRGWVNAHILIFGASECHLRAWLSAWISVIFGCPQTQFTIEAWHCLA